MTDSPGSRVQGDLTVVHEYDAELDYKLLSGNLRRSPVGQKLRWTPLQTAEEGANVGFLSTCTDARAEARA